MEYIIRYYCGGPYDNLKINGTLDEAKAYAYKKRMYTQNDISIFDKDGVEVCRSSWYANGKPGEIGCDTVKFGSKSKGQIEGCYSLWYDPNGPYTL